MNMLGGHRLNFGAVGAVHKGTYIGSFNSLYGRTAIAYPHKVGSLISVQFDNAETSHPVTGASLGFNWHDFDKSDFKLEKRNG